MAGVIDDFQDALNELMRAANLPVSVCVIKIGGMQEENDAANLMTLSSEAFSKCDRQFVQVLDYDLNYKKKLDLSAEDVDVRAHLENYVKKKFRHDLMNNLPEQIEKFYEAQNFDFI